MPQDILISAQAASFLSQSRTNIQNAPLVGGVNAALVPNTQELGNPDLETPDRINGAVTQNNTEATVRALFEEAVIVDVEESLLAQATASAAANTAGAGGKELSIVEEENIAQAEDSIVQSQISAKDGKVDQLKERLFSEQTLKDDVVTENIERDSRFEFGGSSAQEELLAREALDKATLPSDGIQGDRAPDVGQEVDIRSASGSVSIEA